MHTYVFEVLMLVCFGASWPISIAKAWRTKFVRGKSLGFMSLVLLGYISGIVHKVLNPVPATGHVHPVVWLYIFNMVVVAVDLTLYIRYRNYLEKV